MSITTELRDFVDELACHKVTRDMFREIADRIDEQYERELTMARGEAVQHLGSEVAKKYVQLPLDAEGVPFHVGDHVEVPDGLPSEGKPWQAGTIMRLVLGSTCWHVHVLAGGMNHVYLTENVRHHHEPTVEGVLEELLREYDRDDSELTDGEIIEHFAARLRLAGEDE